MTRLFDSLVSLLVDILCKVGHKIKKQSLYSLRKTLNLVHNIGIDYLIGKFNQTREGTLFLCYIIVELFSFIALKEKALSALGLQSAFVVKDDA
jgi:hypothetical protein